jgi:mxaA protein
VKVDVPGYVLSFVAAGKHLTAPVAGFNFTASPFRDDIQPVLDPSVLAPDRAGVAADDSGPRWMLGAGMAMTAVAALGLLMERLPIAGVYRRRAPFAAAARRISRRSSSSQSATTDALLSLHEAFDATVGRRVFADDLDRFFDEHRQFAPFRAETEQFFRLSRAAFFGTGDMPEDLNFARLKTLSRDLMRAERLQ